MILDVNLPDGSGISLLREIKEKDDGIPVLLLTANDMDSDIVDGLEQGADNYITKPFSLTVLRARVNAQLRRAAAVKNGRRQGTAPAWRNSTASGSILTGCSFL